jgi:hypothetical protein
MIPLFAGIAVWSVVASSLPHAALIPAIVVLILYVQLIVAAAAAASSIFNLAIYRYALTGKEHGGFTTDQFNSAWLPKS